MTDERVANQDESSQKIAIDAVRLNMLYDRLRSQQNLVGGVIAGAVAACVGAILWTNENDAVFPEKGVATRLDEVAPVMWRVGVPAIHRR